MSLLDVVSFCLCCPWALAAGRRYTRTRTHTTLSYTQVHTHAHTHTRTHKREVSLLVNMSDRSLLSSTSYILPPARCLPFQTNPGATFLPHGARDGSRSDASWLWPLRRSSSCNAAKQTHLALPHPPSAATETSSQATQAEEKKVRSSGSCTYCPPCSERGGQ